MISIQKKLSKLKLLDLNPNGSFWQRMILIISVFPITPYTKFKQSETDLLPESSLMLWHIQMEYISAYSKTLWDSFAHVIIQIS